MTEQREAEDSVAAIAKMIKNEVMAKNAIRMTREQALLGDARQPMNKVIIKYHRSDNASAIAKPNRSTVKTDTEA